jgi:hypothetical protein
MDRARYLQLIEPAMAIVVKKHEDYGNKLLGLGSYFPHGALSYHQMLHVKTMRLGSLAQQGTNPNFESMEDTLKDLINYAVFWLDHMDKEKRNGT